MAWLLRAGLARHAASPQPDLLLYRFWRPPTCSPCPGRSPCRWPTSSSRRTPPAGSRQRRTPSRWSSGTARQRPAQRVLVPSGHAAVGCRIARGPGGGDARVRPRAGAVHAADRRDELGDWARLRRWSGRSRRAGTALRRRATWRWPAICGGRPRARPPQGTFVRNGIVITPTSPAWWGRAAFARAFHGSVPSRRRGSRHGDGQPGAAAARCGGGAGAAGWHPVYQAAGGVETMNVPLDGLLPGEDLIGFRIAFPDTTITLGRGCGRSWSAVPRVRSPRACSPDWMRRRWTAFSRCRSTFRGRRGSGSCTRGWLSARSGSCSWSGSGRGGTRRRSPRTRRTPSTWSAWRSRTGSSPSGGARSPGGRRSGVGLHCARPSGGALHEP